HATRPLYQVYVWCIQLLSQPVRQRQAPPHLPLVLRVEAELLVVDVLDAPPQERARAVGAPEQEVSDRVSAEPAGKGVAHRRVGDEGRNVARRGEAEAELHAVPLTNPGEVVLDLVDVVDPS